MEATKEEVCELLTGIIQFIQQSDLSQEKLSDFFNILRTYDPREDTVREDDSDEDECTELDEILRTWLLRGMMMSYILGDSPSENTKEDEQEQVEEEYIPYERIDIR